MKKPVDAKIRLLQSCIPEPNTGCWLWTAALLKLSKPEHPMFYGKFWMNGKTIGAYRASWIIFNGPIPEGLCVLHKCDVSLCVNPQHLFLGTNADNTHDMIAKGRNQRTVESRRGELNNFAKLTTEQVALIRSAKGFQREIAAQYGITQSAVSQIKSGRNWGWLSAVASV